MALVFFVGTAASATSQIPSGVQRERQPPVADRASLPRPDSRADIERLLNQSERQARSIRWLWVGHFVWFVFAASTTTWRLLLSELPSRPTKEVKTARSVAMVAPAFELATLRRSHDDELLSRMHRLEAHVAQLHRLAEEIEMRSAAPVSVIEEAPSVKAPIAAPPVADAVTTLRADCVWYAEAPNWNGTFQEDQFTLKTGPLSLYQFNAVTGSQAPSASVTLCQEADVLRRAILNADSLLRPACEYDETPGPQHNQIAVIEPGHAECGDQGWQVRRKIVISFS